MKARLKFYGPPVLTIFFSLTYLLFFFYYDGSVSHYQTMDEAFRTIVSRNPRWLTWGACAGGIGLILGCLGAVGLLFFDSDEQFFEQVSLGIPSLYLPGRLSCTYIEPYQGVFSIEYRSHTRWWPWCWSLFNPSRRAPTPTPSPTPIPTSTPSPAQLSLLPHCPPDCAWAGQDLRAVDLSQVDLRGAIFDRTGLARTNLSGANLSQANLARLNFMEANLSGANLSGTDLTQAELSYADLSGADLRGAILDETYLFRTNLSGANLQEVDLSGVVLAEANLNGAIMPDGWQESPQ